MKNKNLISISGKKGSGKDTVGKIIQYFTLWQVIRSKEYDNPEDAIGGSSTYKNKPLSEWTWEERMNHKFFNGELKKSDYHIKRWADALKEMCAIILNVPVSKFEDQEFKASELGEEWWSWNVVGYFNMSLIPEIVARYNTKEEALQHIADAEKRVHYLEELRPSQVLKIEQFKPTVRWLLQNIGTEVGRNIHPNMWVNILMNQYKSVPTSTEYRTVENIYPQWIITDTRFENELQAIQDRNGLCVKVEKDNDNNDTHKSETNLDHIKEWDWVFNNNGSIEDLIEQVKEFLTHFKII